MARDFVTASAERLRFSGTIPSNMTTHPLTFSAWVYVTSLATESAIMAVYDTGIREFMELTVATSGQIRFRVNQTGRTPQAAGTSTQLTVDNWNHVCGVSVNQNERHVYLNGGGKGSNTVNRTVNSMDEFSIGASFLGDLSTWQIHASARIAQVAWWNEAFTDAKVLSLAQKADPRKMSVDTLEALYYLDGLHDPEPDSSGRGLTMDIDNGTPTAADGPPLPPRNMGYTRGRSKTAAAAPAAILGHNLLLSGDRNQLVI